MTMVSCMASEGIKIRALACVDRQDGERCFCQKSAEALNFVSEENEPEEGDSTEIGARKKKMRDKLSILKARASGFFRQPPDKRYSGPALVVLNGGKGKATLISGELPSRPPPMKSRSAVVDDREDSHEEEIAEQEQAPKEPSLVEKGIANQSRTKEIEERMKVKREKYLAKNAAAKPVAAGATRMEASNDSVRRPDERLNPETVERPAPAMSPSSGEEIVRAAQGVAEISATDAPAALSIAAIKEAAFRAAHEKTGGKIRQMARELGVSRSTVQRNLDRLGLRGDDTMPSGPLAADKVCTWKEKPCPEVIRRPSTNKKMLCGRHRAIQALRDRRAAAAIARAAMRDPTPAKAQTAAADNPVVDGLDLGNLTMAQLLACPGELRRRLQVEHDKYSDLARRADYALSGEPFPALEAGK